MIQNKKEFGLGLLLVAVFLLVLVGIFSPLFAGGRNTLDYLDSTFNSISKDSAYYIPAVKEKAGKLVSTTMSVNFKSADTAQAARVAKLLGAAGGTVTANAQNLAVTGDLGQLLDAVLADADLMFRNDGDAVAGKYGFDGRRVLVDWHQTFSAMAKDLTRQGRFGEARMLREVQTKAIEPAYNYYGIEAVPMSRMFWVAMGALVGYVVYTIWYGYAILFLFEGWGIRLKH
ncbi:MAG TPA: hypothetical protein VMC81_09915 [Rhodocyclaceae bacterium]|nr:hypothetical protein [Rhodocyclaceae bacterium]